MMNKKLLAVILIALATFPLYGAAKHVVTGKVTGAGGDPIIGVAVLPNGKAENGTSTDADGKYKIEIDDPNGFLCFQCIGFKTAEMPLNGLSELNVVLQDEADDIDEVVFVAYGTQKKLNLTGSVSQISSKDLKTAPSGNISAILGGKLPGLVSRQTSGQPGADGANLYIRGAGAGDGQMLVVVDGVIRDFPDVNPDEIESIAILKDATSAAAYGVRASAGVMVITTKHGSEQKPTISFNTACTLTQNTSFPEFLDGGGVRILV